MCILSKKNGAIHPINVPLLKATPDPLHRASVHHTTANKARQSRGPATPRGVRSIRLQKNTGPVDSPSQVKIGWNQTQNSPITPSFQGFGTGSPRLPGRRFRFTRVTGRIKLRGVTEIRRPETKLGPFMIIRPMLGILLISSVSVSLVAATESDQETPQAASSPKASKKEPSSTAVPAGWVQLSPTEEVWVDKRKKRVIAGGKICLRKGLLEMFACPRGTKEHESIVAVNGKSSLVHAGLLAIGAKPGSPVRYDPEYRAATGPIVDVEIAWRDKNGKTIKRSAQEMIRNVRTRKPMTDKWVFAGSGFGRTKPRGSNTTKRRAAR